MKAYVFFLGILLLLSGLVASACMTPRQVDAATLVRDAVAEGRLSQEEGQKLIDAMSPSTWLDDVLKLVGTGGVTWAGINWQRNRARRLRGEPVKVAKAKPA